MSGEPLYDLNYISQISKGNTALIERLCSTFITSATKILSELKTALAKGDLTQVGAEAHKIKSMIAAMNMHRATELMQEILESLRFNTDVESVPEKAEQGIFLVEAAIEKLKTDLSI